MGQRVEGQAAAHTLKKKVGHHKLDQEEPQVVGRFLKGYQTQADQRYSANGEV